MVNDWIPSFEAVVGPELALKVSQQAPVLFDKGYQLLNAAPHAPNKGNGHG
ncbi:MAG: hypothetical protein KC418_15175 [Anaerolineales bacterium]|nr:hypothetical protein [Anaerolineales bacterium]MCB8953232.1 hypothetical protein [Ardenticatenales bacterium]